MLPAMSRITQTTPSSIANVTSSDAIVAATSSSRGK